MTLINGTSEGKNKKKIKNGGGLVIFGENEKFDPW